MIELLDGIGRASLALFWVPAMAWTGLLLALVLLLHAGGRLPALLRYRLAQAVLLALPGGVAVTALLQMQPLEPISSALPSLPMITVGAAEVLFEPAFVGEAVQRSVSITGWTFLGALTLIAAAVLLSCLVRLIADARTLLGLRQGLRGRLIPGVSEEVEAARQRFGVDRRVTAFVAANVPVPMTWGAWRPHIILPDGLSAEDRALAIAHEMVHIRQHDFLGHWAERLATVLFAIHPGVHWLSRQCDLLREMSCDAALLAETPVARQHYARLLFAFAVDASDRNLLAIGMADRRTHIHMRLDAMRSLPKQTQRIALRTPWLAAAAVLLTASIAVATPRFATAERPTLPAVTGADGSGIAGDTVFVVVEEMPAPIGGLEGIQRRVVYDEDAREEGIEGVVFLQFVVGTDGRVEDVTVVRGVDPRLDQAARRAVAETSFTPGQHRGEPVAVRLSLPVRFVLDEDVMRRGAPGQVQVQAPPPPSAPPAPDAAPDGVFVVVEEMPEPIGGMAGLQERVVYPELARRAGIEGTVFVQFIVNEEGATEDIRVVRGIGAGADEAAIAAVEQTRFTPGRQRGEAVKVRMSLPVRFRLPSENGTQIQMRNFGIIERPDGNTELRVDGTVLHEGRPLPYARVRLQSVDDNAISTGEGSGFSFVFSPPPVEAGARIRVIAEHPSFGRHQEIITVPARHATIGNEASTDATTPAARPTGDEPVTEFATHGVFPNPTQDAVTISFSLPDAADVRVEVYDMAGRRVFASAQSFPAGARHNYQIPTEGLAAGTYAYRLHAGEHSASGTLTIAR